MKVGSSGAVLAFLTLGSSLMLPAAEPVLAYGVTNVAIGNAELNAYPDYGSYSVNGLGSNGLDGVSVYVGEPDGGVFFSPTTGYLEDGNYMVAKTYGALNGTNNSLLATIQGGRASRQVYPLRMDYSPLSPTSVTYQIFYNGVLQREFTHGTPMVVVDYGYGTYPTVNPLMRRSDGAIGTQIKLSQPETFTFPELLSSAGGDELFIRVNNPTNPPGIVSRVDIFGGGQLYDFSFNNLSLGVFGREHQSLYGAGLQARPNWLRIGNFVNTNYLPGVLIKLEQVGALNLQFEPFSLVESNAALLVTAGGTASGDPYRSLGTLRMDRRQSDFTIGFEQGDGGELLVMVLTNGSIVYSGPIPASDIVSVGTNAFIRSITAHAKTLENLPGFHVQFSDYHLITVRTNVTVRGDEVRLLIDLPARMEHLNNIYVAGTGIEGLTITNEITTSPAGPARLEIARALESVVVKWPDPNRLLALGYSTYGGVDGGYWSIVTNSVTFNDPYRTTVIPIVQTNKSTFFRLFYQPSD